MLQHGRVRQPADILIEIKLSAKLRTNNDQVKEKMNFDQQHFIEAGQGQGRFRRSERFVRPCT
jgi:hypothetical protein